MTIQYINNQKAYKKTAGYGFKCGNQRCTKHCSMFRDTVLYDSRILMQDFVMMMWYWCFPKKTKTYFFYLFTGWKINPCFECIRKNRQKMVSLFR